MKKALRKILLLILFPAFIILQSCLDDLITTRAEEENIPSGILTEIRGTVKEPVKGLGIENAEVRLFGHGFVNFLVFSDGIDLQTRTNTDEDGNFAFDFTTNGEYFGYEIEIYEGKRLFNNSTDTVITGVLNEITLTARQLTDIRLNIKIDSNSVGPIRVLTARSNRSVINFSTLDTTVSGRLFPSSLNTIRFIAFDSAEQSNRIRLDSLSIAEEDSLEIDILLEDPINWALND